MSVINATERVLVVLPVVWTVVLSLELNLPGQYLGRVYVSTMFTYVCV